MIGEIKVVGLTGGIGSGKSTVAKMFEALGVPVYYADYEAKKLMNTSLTIKNKLLESFGAETYISEKLNRKFLANLVFNNKEKLAQLNAIVHPEVNKHFKDWVKKQTSKYVIQENAIIFENDKQGDFDAIITVTAPLEVKINRVMARDSITKENVLARMNNQWNDEDKILHSHYVIHNIDLEQSKLQVNQIHSEIMLD